jgi:hypothetical protein
VGRGGTREGSKRGYLRRRRSPLSRKRKVEGTVWEAKQTQRNESDKKSTIISQKDLRKNGNESNTKGFLEVHRYWSSCCCPWKWPTAVDDNYDTLEVIALPGTTSVSLQSCLKIVLDLKTLHSLLPNDATTCFNTGSERNRRIVLHIRPVNLRLFMAPKIWWVHEIRV